MRKLVALLAVASISSAALAQTTFNTTAPFAYMKDVTTGQVLLDKSSNERMPPASMAKMMSVYLAFDMIKRGEVKLDQMVTVRPETWEKWHGPKAGSTMFLSPNEQVSVENLLHGIVTLSGNDACVVLAEGLAGTEEQYVAAMNAMAKKIGLTGSRFANTNGWPDPNEYVTPKDLAIIAERTIRDFPNLYKKFYGQPSFTWGKTLGGGNPITQANRDPLLGAVQGADGLKTGHTEEAGYGFTGSAARDGRRLVMVIAGLTSFNERMVESRRFMEWGFAAWKAVPIAKAGRVIDTAKVWNGEEAEVGLTVASDVALSVPRFAAGGMSAKVVYTGPIKAPIAKGQRVAELVVSGAQMPTARIPLVAATAVGEAGPIDRLTQGVRRLFTGG